MVKIIVAMEREAQSLKEAGCTLPIYVCGIGCTDIPADLTEDDIIVNVGYAGSLKLPVGTICIPIAVYDKKYHLFKPVNDGISNGILCVTTETFIEGGGGEYYPPDTIFDMELARIVDLPPTRVISVKIVSDNCNEKACEAFNNAECWKLAWEWITHCRLNIME